MRGGSDCHRTRVKEKTGAAVMERIDAVIADSAKLLGFEKLKDKQVEAAKAFVSGSDVFVSL